MARQAKDFKNLNCKVDKEVSDLLEKFIADTGLSKTATVEKALKMYIEHYKKTGRDYPKVCVNLQADVR